MPRCLFPLLVLGAFATPLLAAPPIEVRPPRTDSFGDPLPIGAVARLGTIRWKGGPQMIGLAFSLDGKLVAASGGDNRIRVWDFPSGILLKNFDLPNVDATPSLVFSADQKRLLLGGRNTLNPRSLDLATGKLSVLGVPQPQNGNIGIVVSPNGQWAFCHDIEGNRRRLIQIEIARPQRQREFGVIPLKDQSDPMHAAISSDGRWAAIGTIQAGPNGAMGRIYLFDTVSGKSSSSSPFPCSEEIKFLFSPDSKSLAIAYETEIVRWEIKPPKGDSGPDIRIACQYRLPIARSAVEALAFSGDGKKLGTIDANGQLIVWDAANGKSERNWFLSPNHGVCVLAISPDGKTIIATTGQAVGVRVFDIDTGREHFNRIGHRGAIADLAFHPSGKSLASCSADDCSIRTWDLTPKRTPIFTSSAAIVVEDRIRGREYAAIEKAGEGYEDIAFADKGRLLFAGRVDGPIDIWDLTKRSLPRTLAHEAAGRRGFDFAVSTDGNCLAVGLPGSRVQLYDPRKGQPLKNSPNIDEPLDSMYVSSDGKFVGIATVSGRFRICEVATGRDRKPTLPNDKGVANRYFLSAIEAENTAMMWDRYTGRLVRRIEGVGRQCDLSLDGRYFASRTDVGIALRDLSTGKIIREWNTAEGAGALRFSPDGSLLAVGYFNGTILLWDARPPRGKPLSAREVAKRWPDLAGDNAFAVSGELIASPKETVAFLKDQLKPTPPVDSVRVSQLFAGLDHPRYAVREKATRQLETLADQIEDRLGIALPRANAEVTRRIDRILTSIRLNLPKGDRLRSLRSVEILERIGTPEAKQLLATLVKSEGALGREARDALERLREQIK